LNILLYLLRSWDVETEVIQRNPQRTEKRAIRTAALNYSSLSTGRKKTNDPFAEVWGIWANRNDVDDKTLRNCRHRYIP